MGGGGRQGRCGGLFDHGSAEAAKEAPTSSLTTTSTASCGSELHPASATAASGAPSAGAAAVSLHPLLSRPALCPPLVRGEDGTFRSAAGPRRIWAWRRDREAVGSPEIEGVIPWSSFAAAGALDLAGRNLATAADPCQIEGAPDRGGACRQLEKGKEREPRNGGGRGGAFILGRVGAFVEGL